MIRYQKYIKMRFNFTNHKFCKCTWSVQKVSRISSFCGLRIFDFFVTLCWYSYPSLVPTNSAGLNVQFIFDTQFVTHRTLFHRCIVS